METGGSNDQRFIFELDGDKEPLDTNLAPCNNMSSLRLSVTEFIFCHRFLNVKCFPGNHLLVCLFVCLLN